MTSFWSADRLWPGETVVCLGTGPSLTRQDVEWCQGKARVIAVNNAHELAPWADVLYAADQKWWRWNNGVLAFAGLRVAMAPQRVAYPGMKVMRNGGRYGLTTARDALCTGFNSGYQAINLAVHLGAARILLLGYDMRGLHFFGRHPDNTLPPFASCVEAFKTLVEPLAAAGVSVVNCTPASAVRAFPMAALSSALVERAA